MTTKIELIDLYEARMAQERQDLLLTIRRMKTVLIMCKIEMGSTMQTDNPATLLAHEAAQWGIDVANAALDSPRNRLPLR